ncbi:phytanoyl-CoA dioxygenase family protein [Phenylobacterium hankyongense]|uniref:Phytanoyl-CoA dioxygenase family protein n=1 Tax=Phenylobacterium hankyongense TaxID=1813876 RepID=A0A328AVA6_9CAUL|nr:phytanoyl-CoA dioxygenase family protein [Phenylobacterium hankyongense]RAK58943.1 phytanoyl-CoA dioxygenase family protein [Phenylobacterium hankyongense]
MTANGLTDEQRSFYQENGYIHIRGLLTPQEAAAYRAECHSLVERIGENDATWASVRDQGMRLTHCHDVQFQSAAFTRLLVDERLTGVATSLIGPNVQLHHTKMFIKPPEKGSPFPMHQDYPYFPHEGNSMIAAIIHFDDAPDDKGCLRVAPGSHKLGPLEPVGEDHHLPQFPLEAALPLPAKAGDAIFMSYLLVHGSGVNRSQEARTTILVQMRDPADRPLVEKHGSRGQGMMLAGVDPTHGAFEFAWAKSA